MESIVDTLILITMALITTWFLNKKLDPQEIQILSSNGTTITYMYHNKWDYGCPPYCATDHIHFINDSLYVLMLKQNKIIKK